MPQLVSADHIAAEAGAFEPQRKNNFSLIIPVDGSTLIQRSLDSFPLVKESNEPVLNVAFGNESRKVAGPAAFESVNLVLKDFVDQQVGKTMLKWRRKVYDPNTGEIGWAKDYKKTGEVVMFGPDGTVERRWKLIGVWPSAIDQGGGDMNANENNKITVTLTIDKVIEQF